MKDLPIGFIDSGFGGLTVVKQSLKQLPNESVIYIGDSARAPYGPRPLSEVKRYIWQLTNFLREKGIKLLVIACNTGTAAALSEIRKTLAIPVVGVIHAGSRSAIKQTNNKHIGIIGTQGTIGSHLYQDVLLEKSQDLKVFSLAVPEFVQIVEENRIDHAETQAIVNGRLAHFKDKDIDTLVLGCTHYPLLKSVIQKAIGPEVKLIDSGVETINEVSTILDYFNLSRTAEDARQKPATLEVYTTGDANKFGQFARVWLFKADLMVGKARIKGEIIIEDDYCES